VQDIQDVQDFDLILNILFILSIDVNFFVCPGSRLTKSGIRKLYLD